MIRHLTVCLSLLFFRVQGDENGKWETTNGPSGGTFEAIEACGGCLFAAPAHYTLFKSCDMGSTWEPIDSSRGIHGHIIRMHNHLDTLYAGTTSDGLFRTVDTGSTWEQVWSNPSSPWGESRDYGVDFISVFSEDMFVVTLKGQGFRSTDRGKTWDSFDLFTYIETAPHTMYEIGSELYSFSLYSGVGRSEDRGTTWEFMNEDLPGGVNAVCQVDGRFVAVIDSSVYRSSDTARTWDLVWDRFPSAGRRTVDMAVVGNTIFVTRKQDSANSVCVYTSNTYGESWERQACTAYEDWFRSSAVLKDGLFAGTNRGVYNCGTDGNFVKDVSDGIAACTMMDLCLSDAGILGISYNGRLGTYNENTKEWSINQEVQPKAMLDLSTSGETIYLGAWKRLFVSHNNGETWEEDPRSGEFNPLATLLVNDTLFVADGSTILRKSPHEDAFSIVRNGDGFAFSSFPAPCFLYHSGSRLYAGLGGDLLVTKDGGENWSRDLPDSDIFRMAESGGVLYATARREGVYRSFDHGTTWQAPEGTFSGDGPIAAKDSLVAVAHGGGVSISIDQGETWKTYNQGIGRYKVTCLLFSDNYLYAGTQGASVWMLSLSALGISAADRLPKWQPVTPHQRMDARIAPSGKLVVRISQDMSKQVTTLNLRDAMGRVVLQSNLDRLRSGLAVHEWDTRKIVAGSYVVEAVLEGGDRLTQPIILPR